MKNLQERFAIAFPAPRERGLHARIAEICKVSAPTVSAWFKLPNKVSTIDRSNAEKICRAFNLDISPEWLAEGTGPQNLTAIFDVNVRKAPLNIRSYPVLTVIEAIALKDNDSPYKPEEGINIEYGDDDASVWAFFLEIEGTSMLPDFKPGDRVMIDPEVSPNPGDFVLARNGEQNATFKKYRVRGIDQSGAEIFELVPMNADYPILRSDECPLEVIGTMVEHRRKFRRK